MIIKTKTTSGTWRFYDGAREVQSSPVDKDKIPLVEDLPNDDQSGVGFEFEGMYYENMVTFPLTLEVYLMITFLDHAEKKRHLFVEGETYLLNDGGKTIERLF